MNSSKLIILFCLGIGLLSCNMGGKKGNEFDSDSDKHGGVFAYNESGSINSIFPPSIYYQSELQIAGNIVETLVKMNSDMSLKPGLAESWELTEDGLEYLFKVREGVFFQDNSCFPDGTGRELKASDIAFCFTKICEDFKDNAISHYFRGVIKGADEYYKGQSPDGVSGIEVLGDYEIKITLEKPYSEFIRILSNSGLGIYAPEFYENNRKDPSFSVVGTGPFMISKFEYDQVLILEKHKNYWAKDAEGDALPYLSGVKISFENDKKKELSSFKSSILNFIVDIPKSQVSEIKSNDAFALEKSPIMGTKFLAMFMPNEILSDKQLRKAFQYAIDKDFLVDSIMGKVGIPAKEGVIPPIFSDYQSETEIGYEFNKKSAQYSLEMSTLNEMDFRQLDIMTTNRETDILLANEIRDMIKENLDINLSVKYFHPDEYYALIEKGQASLFIDGYFGDYPSPENFLYTLFYGKYVPESLDEYPGYNIYRYRNPFYDMQLDSARYSRSDFERKVYFQKAERMLMLDAVVVPLFYFETEYAISKNVQNFKVNPLKQFDLSTVYFANLP